MTKGKPWTFQEESTLRKLLKDHASLEAVARQLGKTREAVRQKMIDLGLKEQQQLNTNCSCSSDLKLPEELPTVEDALKTLSAALKALEQPGLAQTEVLRLKGIIHGIKVYKELFTDYANYRRIENELVELRQALGETREAYETLAKKPKNNACRPAEP